MKHFSLISISFLLALHATAQSEKYTVAMSKALTQLDSAKSAAQYREVAHTFVRIASAEPKEWLPPYYAAYSHLSAAFKLFREDAARAPEALDLAQASLTQARALAPAESEVVAMQAYILIGRVSENPMVKGAELTPQIFAELDKAASMNPENPRAPFLRGVYVLNMPEFYGGGALNAKPFFEKAAALYENAPPQDALLPRWGKSTNARFLEQVGKSEGK